MLRIVVPGVEQFNEATEEFITTKEQALQLEHSLVSLSKWEGKHHKPFLTKEPKTEAETVDYIRCMTLTQNVDPNVYTALTAENLRQVKEYIDESMTATTFPKDRGSSSREIVTAEIIYYWMISNNIPFECQKWHLSRLLTLINVCHAKAGPRRKMPRSKIIRDNDALNEIRLKKFRSRG